MDKLRCPECATLNPITSKCSMCGYLLIDNYNERVTELKLLYKDEKTFSYILGAISAVYFIGMMYLGWFLVAMIGMLFFAFILVVVGLETKSKKKKAENALYKFYENDDRFIKALGNLALIAISAGIAHAIMDSIAITADSVTDVSNIDTPDLGNIDSDAINPDINLSNNTLTPIDSTDLGLSGNLTSHNDIAAIANQPLNANSMITDAFGAPVANVDIHGNHALISDSLGSPIADVYTQGNHALVSDSIGTPIADMHSVGNHTVVSNFSGAPIADIDIYNNHAFISDALGAPVAEIDKSTGEIFDNVGTLIGYIEKSGGSFIVKSRA